MGKKVKFIEVRSEIGAGTRGASLGVDAIKIAALDYGSDMFDRIGSVRVEDENEMLFKKVSHSYAKRIGGVLNIYERLTDTISSSIKANEFPVVIAGDHSTAGGTISGIRLADPGKRVGVIWIDAHADIHSPYTTPSGNVHGMPLAAVLDEDNIELAVNSPSEQTIEEWEKLKNIGGVAPKVRYEDLVYIGVRDIEPEESHLLKKHNVKMISVSEVKRNGVDKVSRQALAYLAHCDAIYISFDVDSLDSSISKGTGTPVRNGLSEKEASGLCVRLVQNSKVSCFELCEVNPTLDKENKMAESSFEILQKVVSQITN